MLAACLLACVLTAGAYTLKAHRGTVPGGYNFWFYEPDFTHVPYLPDSTDVKARPDSIHSVSSMPLILFLHGASLCGNNLDRVRHYGTIDAIERGRKINAYVVAPQNPGGAWSPARLLKLIEWAQKNYDVDPNRIYVIGMSLGGYGTLDMAAAHPDKIAAAMAFCGGSSAKNPEILGELPLWIVHGTGDRAVGVGESDRIVKAIRNSESHGCRLLYNREPGMDHAKPARFFYLQETYDWLLSHRLDQEGRPVAAPFDIIGLSAKAYTDLKYKAKVQKSKGRKSHKKARRRHRR